MDEKEWYNKLVKKFDEVYKLIEQEINKNKNKSENNEQRKN